MNRHDRGVDRDTHSLLMVEMLSELFYFSYKLLLESGISEERERMTVRGEMWR